MTTVPFKLIDSSILVEGKVNGKTVVFIVDTGDAIGPTFNANDAKLLGLPDLGPLEISGAGGDVQISKTQADISLGESTYKAEAGAIDLNLEGPSLLGLPFFIPKKGTLQIDFDAKLLSFGSGMQQPKVKRWYHFLSFAFL